MEVVTASRKPETLQRVPAAVTVISHEEIVRSGATSLPEALRLAPGVEVARINSNQWSVGVRGFASRLSRSVLVMIDGRTVYSPLFAGTYWEVQDTLLEDVDRIEVVRGPGGTLWGANAFNGVINIITRRSSETQGTFALVRAGTLERATVEARHGFRLGPSATASVYGKALSRDALWHADGRDWDAWSLWRGGFHADWDADARTSASLQGDAYSGRLGQSVPIALYEPPFAAVVDSRARVSGGNVVARWARETEDRSGLRVQGFWDRTSRSEANFAEARDTFDVSVQHHVRLPLGQELVSGAGWRRTRRDTSAVASVVFSPADRTEQIVNAFLQDEVALSRRTSVILGTKLERNDYTGWEWQPSLRLVAKPSEKETVWAALSRAVRTPTAVERDLDLTETLDPNGPVYFRSVHSASFVSERVTAWEAGYRAQLEPTSWVDVALFYDRYDHLLSSEPLPPRAVPGVPGTVLELQVANGLEGRGVGGELSAGYAPLPWLRLSGTWSYLGLDLHPGPGSRDTLQSAQERSSPRHQGTFRAAFVLSPSVRADAFLRAVSALPAQRVPGYAELDVRASWRATRALELSVSGWNLLHDHHAEFAGGSPSSVEVPRSAALELAVGW